EKINAAKQAQRRVIAVGTTSLRTLEAAGQTGQVQPGRTSTDIFLYPPYTFKIADGLITNFHLPESTLLMLVSAFTSAPQTPLPFSTFNRLLLEQAYQSAIDQQYRFFSFDDAILIL